MSESTTENIPFWVQTLKVGDVIDYDNGQLNLIIDLNDDKFRVYIISDIRNKPYINKDAVFKVEQYQKWPIWLMGNSVKLS